MIKTFAVLTSGGDAPGMNAAIRSAVRSGIARGWRPFGVRYGYRGLLEDDFVPLGARDVGGIIHKGGTFLGSSRCVEFHDAASRRQAADRLAERDIDALIVIGGNGSQAGALALHDMGVRVVGIASTIDNDLPGTDVTVGTDTALNVALESIDRLRTTAVSHRRVVIVEVMGRDCGYLAVATALAGGAESVVIPEVDMNPEALLAEIQEAYRLKNHALIVVAEGASMNASELSSYIQARPDITYKVRVTILGHVQRGGVPTAFDRLLGSRFGAAAVDALTRNEAGVLVGMLRGHVATTPLTEVVHGVRRPDPALATLASVLAQ